MKLIQLGDEFINPEHVIAVVTEPGGLTKVKLSGGAHVLVAGASPAQIADLIMEAANK